MISDSEAEQWGSYDVTNRKEPRVREHGGNRNYVSFLFDCRHNQTCWRVGGVREGQPEAHRHTQETGSVIQYRPNHSSLPKSRLDGDPTLWGENKTLEPKPKGRGGLEDEWRKVWHIIASRGSFNNSNNVNNVLASENKDPDPAELLFQHTRKTKKKKKRKAVFLNLQCEKCLLQNKRVD